MWKAKLVEEHVHGLHSFDRRGLPAKLEELRAHVDADEEERAAKAGKLATLVVEASNTLMDLEILPIRDVPQNLKNAQVVFKVVGIILECLREAHASGTSPWD
jgi:hypothetical protein